jgi:REP element-mobilizing transposase RayT
MAQPLRLESILAPWHAEIIYFVTLCVSGREHALANQKVFAAIKHAMEQLRRWQVLAAMVMPDHLHAIVAPNHNRDLLVGDFSTGLKRMLRQQIGPQEWDLAEGLFRSVNEVERECVGEVAVFAGESGQAWISFEVGGLAIFLCRARM